MDGISDHQQSRAGGMGIIPPAIAGASECSHVIVYTGSQCRCALHGANWIGCLLSRVVGSGKNGRSRRSKTDTHVSVLVYCNGRKKGVGAGGNVFSAHVALLHQAEGS